MENWSIPVRPDTGDNVSATGWTGPAGDAVFYTYRALFLFDAWNYRGM
jgi:hypothetical protein